MTVYRQNMPGPQDFHFKIQGTTGERTGYETGTLER